MSLTVGRGPFAPHPGGSFNFELPKREGLLYLEDSPRRIRARFAGETIIDSRRPKLLHEHRALPIHCFPPDDVRTDLLEPSEHVAHSATKGEARHWSLRVGQRVAENAAWAHPAPPREAADLTGLLAFDWDAMDEWLEEDEPVFVHARDPYHRIDVLETSRSVRVSLRGELLAESSRARVLFETSLPPRWYLPPEDVRSELLVASDKRTGCAYKGFASYWSVRGAGRAGEDIVWCYPEPLRDGGPIARRLCFFNERVDIDLDGERQERPTTQWSRREE